MENNFRQLQQRGWGEGEEEWMPIEHLRSGPRYKLGFGPEFCGRDGEILQQMVT